MDSSTRTSRRIASQPARSDASWQRRCEPLLLYLATPRRWEELTAWASIRGISGCRLRNMLAWLEDEHVAGTFVDQRRQASPAPHAIWHRSEARSSKPPDEPG